MKTNSLLLAALATASIPFLSDVALGAEIAYKNGAWTWEDNSWEGGSKPGPYDTALIPELPILKTRYDSGRMQSNGLMQDEEVQTLRFADLYGLNVNGTNLKLTLNDIVCDDIVPAPEDTAQIATNRVSMGTLVLKGTEAEFNVGTNHVLVVGTLNLDASDETARIVKTGPGMFELASTYYNATNAFWVKEGLVVRSGNGYPSFKGDLVVGGAGAKATLRFTSATHGTKLPKARDIDIREGGELVIDTGAVAYHEYMSVDHGVLRGGGQEFILSNDNATDRGPEYVLRGGQLLDVKISWPWQNLFTIAEADVPSVLQGTLSETAGYLIDIPDGAAPVDFVLDGRWGGGNRQYGKTGAGTMLFIDRDPYDLYGIGRDFKVEAGTFILQSETAIGLGTNNVVVSAGATFGGTGSQVGGVDPANENRGLRGNLTFNGAQGNRATLAPGTFDWETGTFVSGTLTVGSATQTNNVISSGYGELRCRIDGSGAASCLAVNGRLQLSATDRLAIVGPEKIPAGTYTLATFTNGFDNRFAEVSVNGVDIDAAPGAVTYFDAQGERIAASSFGGAGSIVYNVPEMATLLMIQ